MQVCRCAGVQCARVQCARVQVQQVQMCRCADVQGAYLYVDHIGDSLVCDVEGRRDLL